MFPLYPIFDDLLSKLYRAALTYHQRGANYYAARVEHPEHEREAAEEYRLAGKAYLDVLFACEQYLLSVERDKELEMELQRIQTIFQAVQAIQLHL